MIELDFKKLGGLVPAIAQDFRSGEVLMVGFMNKDAWQQTLSSGRATYFSRSRNKLWLKGESSGHFQVIREIRIDCDNDTVLLMVEQIGTAACHTGHVSCFHQKVNPDGSIEIIGKPIFDPNKVYDK